jgi:hypothetical protein
MRRIAVVALALWAAGCAGEPAEVPPSCDGDGPVVVEAGQGGMSGFAPWSDGDQVEVFQQGEWGWKLELQTSGLDTTSPITSFVRYSLGAATTTEDVGASLTLQCDDAVGLGWAGVFVGLPDELQDAVQDLQGEDLHLTLTATDLEGESAVQELDLVLLVPSG